MSLDSRDWFAPVAVILLLQTIASFLTRLAPIIAPAFMDDLGWTEASIGYVAAANTLGSLAVLMFGSPAILRIGAIRSLQISLAIGALSLALLPAPFFAVTILGGFLIGLSYGVATPAGSDVLQRYAPARRRNLIFSIKQAGVPLGGVIAGVLLPPLTHAAGWRAALVCSGLLVLAVAAGAQIVRGRIDLAARAAPAPNAARPVRLRSLLGPIGSLSCAPGIWRLSLVGAFLAATQACWFAFAVTFLVAQLDYSLATAGLAFALMLGTSVAGRIAVGWAADRTGSSSLILRTAAVTSAAASILFALSGPEWPFWTILLLSVGAGLSVSSWNGVQIAEIARRSPAELVGETAAGSTILIFLSNVLAPLLFSVFVTATRRFDLAFIVAGLVSLLSLPALVGIDRPAERAGAPSGS